MGERRNNDTYEERLLDHEEEDEKAPDYESVKNSGFREPKRLRSIDACGFKHPSEASYAFNVVSKPSLEITMESNQNEEESKMVKNLPEEEGVQLRETTEDMSEDVFDDDDAFSKRKTLFLQCLRKKREELAARGEVSSYEKKKYGSIDDSDLDMDCWEPLYLRNNNKLQEWDSDSDLEFDTYGVDIYPSNLEYLNIQLHEGNNYDVDVCYVVCKNVECDAFDQFVDHYFCVCKSRGYDLDTVPPPENMHWSRWDWICPYPMNIPEEKQEIIDTLQEALVVIHEKTGKKLKLEQIVKVNIWHKFGGRHFFITFEATDEHNRKGTYQTRLVLGWEGRKPPRSIRLLNFVGYPGTVHAFRPKPT